MLTDRLVACLGILILLWAVVSAETDPGDLQVLQSFMQGLINPQVLKWNGLDPCGESWAGVQCQGGFVTGLSLAGAGLMGSLTPQINNLSKLQYLGLQKNSLSGSLPSLQGMQSLQTVYLNNNNFDTIPEDFFHELPLLESMYLDYNNLNSSTGWILSPDVAGCTQLLNLSLTNTNLAGLIPDFLGSMPSLRVLNLAYNNLGGGIPSSFQLSNLVQLQANNMLGPVLTGPIDAIGSMPSLVELWLQVNQIEDTIPSGLSNAVTLESLKLNDNKITGLIPPNLTALPLKVVTVDNNLLVGPLPLFQSGVDFTSFGNNFCQSVPGAACAGEVTTLLEFIENLGYPSKIISSWAGNNPCDSWVGVACDAIGHVSSINLPNCHLSGTLSQALGELPALVYLKLSGNNLTGIIPSSLKRIKSLTLVDLSNNDLSGPVPNFPARITLNVQGNPRINKLSVPTLPTMPPSPTPPILSPPVLSPVLSSPVLSPILSSPVLSPISPLHDIAPPLPSPSGTGTGSGISVPPNMVWPHVASPGIYSTPSPAPQSGHLASGSTKRATSIAIGVLVVAVLGALALLLLLSLLAFFLYKQHHQKPFARVQCPSIETVHPHDSGERENVKTVATGNASATETQSTSGGGPSEMQVIEAGNLVISIQVLKDATQNFSEQSILGRGGFGVVYKGDLHDGTNIAVKRMEAASVSSKGLNEFQAEIAVLTKVRHRHLVALLGYCIDGYEKLLVYEYVPNGTLGQHLFNYNKLGWKPLDWKKRLCIALDVARGLEYLHGLAHKSFIHRDLKPSNILLDDDFHAKVSDFGLVKLAPEGKYSIETRLAGTFGYLAPEYAVTGRVTTKADVFSFGVVLMELISGRKALDDSQSEENMHLVAWFRPMHANKESFLKVIDSVVELDSDTFQSICTVAELASHCTAREPYQRPDMGHAVNVLAPLVEQWKPTDIDWEDSAGIDLNITLPQALKKWQDLENSSRSFMDYSQASLPTRPTGFADSFTSADGR